MGPLLNGFCRKKYLSYLGFAILAVGGLGCFVRLEANSNADEQRAAQARIENLETACASSEQVQERVGDLLNSPDIVGDNPSPELRIARDFLLQPLPCRQQLSAGDVQ